MWPASWRRCRVTWPCSGSSPVLRSRDAHRQLAEQAAAVHADVDARAGQVAADGDGLTGRTTTVARHATPVTGR